jgi:hypothetical protein
MPGPTQVRAQFKVGRKTLKQDDANKEAENKAHTFDPWLGTPASSLRMVTAGFPPEMAIPSTGLEDG